MKRISYITGASGFIGGRLLMSLPKTTWAIGLDRRFNFQGGMFTKDPEWKNPDFYHLAADTGGIGYVHQDPTKIFRTNLDLLLHSLGEAKKIEAKRFFFASSACVYPWMNRPVHEDDAEMGRPDGAIGLAKLCGERILGWERGKGISFRIARLHTIYGPGCQLGPKEKVITSLCRKVAEAADGGFVEVWGSGRQVRTFCYVGDCVEGIYRIMESDYEEPLNLGSSEQVTINEVAQMIINISGKDLWIRNKMDAPEGPPFRVPDNTRLRRVLGWEPPTPLKEGLKKTYQWVSSQIGKEVGSGR